jgi:hypothetical protein
VANAQNSRGGTLEEGARGEPGTPVAKRRHLELTQGAGDIADRIMDDAPFLQGPNVLAALALYRVAALWALTADQEGPRAETISEALGREPSDPLAADAESTEQRERLRAALLRSDRATADLSDAERVEEIGVLQRFLRHRIALFAGSARQVRRRALRRRLPALLLAGAPLLAIAVLLWVTHRDLAANRPWRASSALPDCDLAFNTCAGQSVNIFFHTLEEQSPWVEVDLGAIKRFSRVIVTNRQDCCMERAVPLAIEVSTDGTAYNEVARRQDTFSEWDAKFHPVQARYVRARALRRTLLHLEGLSVR